MSKQSDKRQHLGYKKHRQFCNSSAHLSMGRFKQRVESFHTSTCKYQQVNVLNSGLMFTVGS